MAATADGNAKREMTMADTDNRQCSRAMSWFGGDDRPYQPKATTATESTQVLLIPLHHSAKIPIAKLKLIPRGLPSRHKLEDVPAKIVLHVEFRVRTRTYSD